MRLPVTPTYIEVLGLPRQPQRDRHVRPVGHRGGHVRGLVVSLIGALCTDDVPVSTRVEESVPLLRSSGE
jgi:hypothetical protein